MNKKFLIIVCLMMVTMVFSGCNLFEESKNKETTKDKANTEENQKNDGNPDPISSNKVWPSNMPDFVPEFTYGNNAGIVINRDDNTQWIIAYGDVQYADLESYKVDLEAKGWAVNIEKGAYETATLMAEYNSEEYVISLSHIGETQGAQLNIMKP